MALLETLGIILTSETAGSVAKFLYEKVENYIREKFGNKSPDEVEELKTEIEELKNKLESKEKEDVTESDVEEVRETITHIEKTESQIPPEIISADVFKKWSESDELDVTDQALIVRRRLQILMDKAAELGIKENKKYEIQDTAVNIDQKISRLKQAVSTARLTGFRDDKEEVEKTEMLLRKNIFQAKDLLKGY